MKNRIRLATLAVYATCVACAMPTNALVAKSPKLASALAGDMVTVRGEGMGANRMEALKDAYCDATENAVGILVNAEQGMQNH